MSAGLPGDPFIADLTRGDPGETGRPGMDGFPGGDGMPGKCAEALLISPRALCSLSYEQNFLPRGRM